MQCFFIVSSGDQLVSYDAEFVRLFCDTENKFGLIKSVPEVLNPLLQDIKRLEGFPQNLEWYNATSTFDVQVVELLNCNEFSLLISLTTKSKSELKKSVFLKETEEDAQIGGWVLELPSGELSWSDKVYDIYAVPTSTKLTVSTGLANYTEESTKRLTAYIEEAQKGHSFSDEFDFYDAKGNYKRVISRGRPVLDQKGDVAMIQGTIQDITDTFFEAKRNSLAIEAGKIGVWEYDHLENSLVWNEEMCRLYEVANNARLDYMDWVSAIHPEDRETTVKVFESSLVGESRFNNQYRIVGKQTFEIKYLNVYGQHFKNRLGITTRTIGVTINVSEHKLKQESELVEKALDMQRSKTLALGELAAGIGHEINNPLSILTGNLDLLKKTLHDSAILPTAKHQIANISQCAERIQNITSGLRRLVRDDTYEALSVIDVNEVARTTVNLLKEIYAKQGISVVLELGDSCNVKGHFSELQQVLLNLISNARDAVSKSVHKQIVVSIFAIEKRVCVQVADSGVGIKEEKQKLIFESLYTQKPSGQGTGLGLGICKRIVTEHGGSIEVDSKLGQGATFRVLLPLHSSIVESRDFESSLPEEVQSTPSSTKHSEHNLQRGPSDPKSALQILVVDDEPLILELVQVFLEKQGYQVTCRETLTLAKKAIDSNHFDLVLTDVCMPDGEGTELLDYAEQSSLNTKIAIMTGGVYDEELQNQYPDTLVGFLYKPFTETKLFEFIARIMEGEGGYTTV